MHVVKPSAPCQNESYDPSCAAETHLKSANGDMVAALTKSTEVIAHNSAVIEQFQRKLAN